MPAPAAPRSRKPRPSPFAHPFDVRHGTDTSGLLAGHTLIEGTSFVAAEITAYYGIAPSILAGVLDRWLQETRPALPIDRYTFVDVGAGKGRAMLLAAMHPFHAVEGIEVNAAMAAVARANIDRCEREPASTLLAPLVLHHADATCHPLPSTPILAFLFHPFERKLLRRFVAHVDRSLRQTPRPFDLIYANAEHGSLLDSHPGCTCVWQGRVPMSAEDHAADLAEIAQQKEYGSTGDELCKMYRFRA